VSSIIKSLNILRQLPSANTLKRFLYVVDLFRAGGSSSCFSFKQVITSSGKIKIIMNKNFAEKKKQPIFRFYEGFLTGISEEKKRTGHR
jgi:hypothetical protein